MRFDTSTVHYRTTAGANPDPDCVFPIPKNIERNCQLRVRVYEITVRQTVSHVTQLNFSGGRRDGKKSVPAFAIREELELGLPDTAMIGTTLRVPTPRVYCSPRRGWPHSNERIRIERVATGTNPRPHTIPMRIDAQLAERPDLAYAGPYFVYLVLLGLQGFLPEQWHWLAIAIRGAGALLAVDLVVRHIQDWGRPHVLIATIGGVAAAALWVAGQHYAESLGIPRHFPLMPGSNDIVDPHEKLGSGSLWWSTAALRILVACTAVPIVEELFWRAFLLRALIDWHRFERVPLGAFTWWSFLGTSLLSILQHPANWVVSIFCWFLFNGIFYWTRSITCLIITHAVTNLVLYIYVIEAGDWRFW